MTEDQAKTKLCQMTFNLNRDDHKCVGGQCMAWRTAPDTKQCYCGMAGLDLEAVNATREPRYDL